MDRPGRKRSIDPVSGKIVTVRRSIALDVHQFNCLLEVTVGFVQIQRPREEKIA